jgi:hypothetical protein
VACKRVKPTYTVLFYVVLHLSKQFRVTCSVVNFYQLQLLKIFFFLIQLEFEFIDLINIYLSFLFRKP